MFWVALNGNMHTCPLNSALLTGACVLSSSVAGVEEICCVVELDSPPQQKWMRPLTAGSASTAAEMEWNEELVL